MTITPKAAASLPLLFDFILSPEPPDAGIVGEGLLPPLPLLVSRSGNEPPLRLVWGRHIAEAALAAEVPELRVREFTKEELDPENALLLCLMMEHRRDRYTALELEKLAVILAEMNRKDLEERVAPLVSSTGGIRQASRRLALRQDLRRLAREEKIDLKTAETAAGIPEEIVRILEAVIESLSFSERRIFLKTLAEVLIRGVPEGAESFARRIADSSAPLDEVHRLRHPELSSMEDRFRDISSRILKGSGVTLRPPPYFEGRRFSVSFEFESPAMLDRKLKALGRLRDEGGDLYDLL